MSSASKTVTCNTVGTTTAFPRSSMSIPEWQSPTHYGSRQIHRERWEQKDGVCAMSEATGRRLSCFVSQPANLDDLWKISVESLGPRSGGQRMARQMLLAGSSRTGSGREPWPQWGDTCID
ncbi:unnamed protein product [Effrenium voratum]|nr:unnamed protein product [Effrenium voratum]